MKRKCRNKSKSKNNDAKKTLESLKSKSLKIDNDQKPADKSATNKNKPSCVNSSSSSSSTRSSRHSSRISTLDDKNRKIPKENEEVPSSSTDDGTISECASDNNNINIINNNNNDKSNLKLDENSISLTESLSSDDSLVKANALGIVADDSFLLVELKMTSVDFNCIGFKPISQNFLCINSNATASHIISLIFKKTELMKNLYEIVLMCNGYEVKPECPLAVLKNKFFPDKETTKIYYAILEKKASVTTTTTTTKTEAASNKESKQTGYKLADNN